MTNNAPVSRKVHVQACKLILSFLHEYDLPLTQEVIDEVAAIRSGSHEQMAWWQGSKFRLSWVESLQSIDVMPTYDQIRKVKEITEDAIDLYLE